MSQDFVISRNFENICQKIDESKKTIRIPIYEVVYAPFFEETEISTIFLDLFF